MLSVSLLSFTGATYLQNFDSLPNSSASFSSSGPFDAVSPTSGSTIDTGTNPQGLGASGMVGWSIAEYSGQDLNDFISSDASTTGGIYDFGTASGAANRALGLILTNGNSPEIGLAVVNSTGVTLPQVEISFTGEQWTENTGNQELDFYYTTTATALPLSSSAAVFTQDANLSWATNHTVKKNATFVDGTSSTYQQGMSDVISGLNWTNGSTLFLMWREFNVSSSAAMAIDNFSLSADATAPSVTSNVLIINPGTATTITSSQLSTAVSPAGIPNSQITYTVGSAPAHGILANGGTTLTVGSSFSQADIVADNITYTPGGSGAASDNFTFTVSDGVQTTAAGTFTTLTDVAGNQAPVNTVPSSQSVIENTSLVYSSANGNAVLIADPDAGSASVQVALSVSHGVLTLGGSTGLIITAGSNGSASLTFTGAIANLNNALNGLTYVPAANYTGSDSLQIVTNDLGNAGAGGPQTATSTVAIAVVAAPLLNEIEANSPGTSDNRYQYVELRGAAGASLNNVYLVVFDGISTNNPGTADLVVDLSPYSLGSNGLLVVKSVNGTGHSLNAATTLVPDSFFTPAGGFNNGTLSFYLFFSTSPFSSGADYDTTDDGRLDHLPSGSQVLDDLAVLDTDKSAAGDIAYGPAVVTEGNNTGTPDAATRFAGSTTPSSSAAWYGGELVDTDNLASQIDYDSTRESANEPPNTYLTPGDLNVPSAVATSITVSPATGTYGGKTTLSATLTSGGAALANETVTFSLNNSTVGTATTNAGGIATLSSVGLAGLSAGAYSACVGAGFLGYANDLASSGAANLTVNAAPLTVSGITAANKVYDGTTAATLNTGSAALVGLLKGDTVNLNVGGAGGTFASQYVGKNISVSVSGLTLDGPQAGNYSLTQPSTTAKISHAPLTVTADNQVMVYGGAIPILTASYHGFVNGETSANLTTPPTLTTTATAASPVGSYNITVSGAVDPNYNISYVTGTLTIGLATLTWKGVSNGNWTDTQWSGSGLPYPNIMANAVVDTPNLVQVTSGQAANSLAISQDGEVSVAAGASLSVTTGTSVTGGGTLNVDPNGAFSTGGILTIDTGGILSGGPIAAAAYQLNDGTASANLSGPGSLTKNTSGTVVLSGSNSYTGGTVVNGGTLIVTAAKALPNGTSLTVGAGGIFVFDPSSSAAAITSPATSGGKSMTTTAPVATNAASSSLVLVAPAATAVSPSRSVATAGSAPVANSAGDSLVPSSATVTTSPPALPLPASVAGPRTNNPGNSVFADALGTSASDRVSGKSTARRIAGNPSWLAQAANRWDNSDQQRRKDVAILVLEAVFAEYG